MSTLGPEQKESYASFVGSLNEEQRESYAKLLPSTDNIKVPSNQNEIIALLLKGKHAAFSNIASPKANIYKEHAIISISELLDHGSWRPNRMDAGRNWGINPAQNQRMQ